MEDKKEHFIEVLGIYSFGNCKKAYHFHHAGLKLREIAKLISEEPPRYKNHHLKEMIQAYTEALEFEEKIEVRRQEIIKHNLPSYQRPLNSWENEIITRARKGEHCWYASLDTRGAKHCNTDFVTGAGTRQDAIRFCALKIRVDNLGIGKFAPHKCIEDNSYTLHWEFAPYWRKKETKRNYRQRKRIKNANS